MSKPKEVTTHTQTFGSISDEEIDRCAFQEVMDGWASFARAFTGTEIWGGRPDDDAVEFRFSCTLQTHATAHVAQIDLPEDVATALAEHGLWVSDDGLLALQMHEDGRVDVIEHQGPEEEKR